MPMRTFLRSSTPRSRPFTLTVATLATFIAPFAIQHAAFADSTGSASVTPVDNSGTQIHTTVLPAQSTTQASAPAPAPTAAQATPPAANATPGQVVVSGKVPDEATKAAVLQKLRATYGAANVLDQIEVRDVATPPNWSTNVQQLLGPQLKQIRKGQLVIDGTSIDVKGEVGNEALRQQLVSNMANTLNPTYTIRNGLRVSASEQGLLDQTLANRTIEFETGSATLTPQGRAILDQMAAVLTKMNTRTVEIIGHTDNAGNRAANIALSQARADAVKGYLVAKGISPQQLTTTGVGPDQPIASNDTTDGRARNRRIEFRAGL